MAATTGNTDDRSVTFKLKGGPSNMPYNKFKVTPKVKGKTDGDMMLVDREKDRSSLGLNKAWLQPPAGVAIQENDNFPFWGHRIYQDIQNFNKRSTKKRRVLCYDIRHGEADHNRWKNEALPDKWGDSHEEYRKCPVFNHNGVDYCIIDPPLTKEGEKDAERAKKIFQTLKRHGFPMPDTVYISPLYRAMQTFETALPEDLGIKRGNCYIAHELREQETGNCADILIGEFLKRQKRPPPPGSGICYSWMEPDIKIDGHVRSEKLEERVKKLSNELPHLPSSDCIARVTHSLLNRQTLKSLLEVSKTDDTSKVLEKFMLDEGGVFVYVIELEKQQKVKSTSTKAEQTPKYPKYDDYRKKMARRRLTAFSKDGEIPAKDVEIEPDVVEIANDIEKENDEREKLIGYDQNVERELKVNIGNIVGSGSNDTTKRIPEGRTSLDGRKIVVHRESPGDEKIAGSNDASDRRVNTGNRRNTGNNRNIDSRKLVVPRENAGEKKVTGSNDIGDRSENTGKRRSTGKSKNNESAEKVNQQKNDRRSSTR